MIGNNRTVKIKIDKDLAIRADYLFYELGITMEQVISEYLKVAVDSQSLPIVSITKSSKCRNYSSSYRNYAH